MLGWVPLGVVSGDLELSGGSGSARMGDALNIWSEQWIKEKILGTVKCIVICICPYTPSLAGPAPCRGGRA